MNTNNGERGELVLWAQMNKKDATGRWRTPDEIAGFAMMNGFSSKLVHEVFSDWQVGTGLDLRMREALGVGCELRYLERLSLLHDSWRELGKYLTDGTEWGA